jgi:hypothetical protein
VCLVALPNASSALAGGPPSIVRVRANHITSRTARLAIRVDTGDLATSYRVIVVDPCPEPEECIVDAIVAEGTLLPASHPRHLLISLAEPNPPFIEPGTDYEYHVRVTNQAGEAESTGVFETKP